MPAPANDNFASAQALSTSLPNSLTGLTTRDATEEASEPNVGNGGSNIEQGIWFTFTPSVTGFYQFVIPLSSLVYNGTASVSSADCFLTLFNASCVSLATATFGNILAQDWGTPDPSWSDPHDPTVSGTLTAGTTYYVKIASTFGTTLNRSTVNFDFEWSSVSPPANDDFADAEVISGESGTVLADNNGATAEGSEPSPNYQVAAAVRSVWYSWTAPSDGRYRFQAGDNDNDVLLAIWTGASLGSLTSIVRNDDGDVANEAAVVGFIAESGTTYMIQIDSRNPNSSDLIWEKLADAEGFDQGSAIQLAPAAKVSGIYDNLGHTEPAPADADTRFAAFSGYTGGDTYHFGATKWFVLGPATYPLNLAIRATDVSGYSEFGMFVYDGNLDPRETIDGFDAVAISDYDDGLRIPVSSTNFSVSDVDNALEVHIPAGEVAYLVVAGFVVEEWAA